jgi:putative membrane protein
LPSVRPLGNNLVARRLSSALLICPTAEDAGLAGSEQIDPLRLCPDTSNRIIAMWLRNLLVAGALLGTPVPAHAQQAAVSAQDFVAAAASSNKFEARSSKMALKASTNKDVKSFAQEMIDDHSRASKGLKAAAKAENMEIPKALDDKHQAMLTALEGKKGAEFDRIYIDEQTKAHDEAVNLFTAYSQSGDKPKLKAFAAETLPTLKKHQEHVKKLQPGSI